MQHILDMLVKLVSTIRVRDFIHREFIRFLTSIEWYNINLLYNTKARQLTAKQVFEGG